MADQAQGEQLRAKEQQKIAANNRGREGATTATKKVKAMLLVTQQHGF